MIHSRGLHATYTSSSFNVACLTVLICSYWHYVYTIIRLRIFSQHGQGLALSVPHCSRPLCIVSQPPSHSMYHLHHVSRLLCIAITYTLYV